MVAALLLLVSGAACVTASDSTPPMPPPPLGGTPPPAEPTATLAPPPATPPLTASVVAGTGTPVTPTVTPSPTPLRLPPVTWLDDFLGVAVDGRYAKSVWGTGAIGLASGGDTGGTLLLSTTGGGAGVARLRFGEDPKTGLFDVQNFAVAKNVVLEVRARFNTATQAAYTVGFVGPGDPAHVLAAIYNSSVNREWGFQANNGTARAYAGPSTGFQHRPDTWHTFRFVTQGGPTPKASLFIDGVERGTVTGAAIPATGLVPELQVWNKQAGTAWSAATLQVDYLRIEQER
jgi:hypothetical protein